MLELSNRVLILVKTDTQPKKYDRTITVVILTTTKKKTNYFPPNNPGWALPPNGITYRYIDVLPLILTVIVCFKKGSNQSRPVERKGQFLSNYNDYSIIPPTFKLL